MNKTPRQVFNEIKDKGEYESISIERLEIEAALQMILEDYEFGKRLRHIENPNWRVIFNIHYDVIRELCDQLMRFKNLKTSNHQGLFAFIALNFNDLDDWEFFETIRTMRNKNKYMALDISKNMWQQVELRLDLNVSLISKQIKELLEGC